MAQSAGLHEPVDRLSEDAIDRHWAIVSLQEELEAIDWYDQRVEAASDSDLAGVLAHNRDEEKAHAAMTLEWLRRHDPDQQLRQYLFTSAPILEVEADSNRFATGVTPAAAGGSLGIDRLRSVDQ
jgi:ferritin-like protein